MLLIDSSASCLVLILITILTITCAHAQVTSEFEVHKVAEGVYAAIRQEPPGLTVNANSVFIINDNDVVVVDTTLTPGSAKELLTALRKLTNKPVAYVINTHWHDDHIMGNEVFRDAFPHAEFIGHQQLIEYLPSTGLSNREQAMGKHGYAAFIGTLRERLARNESVFGGPMDDEERVTYASDIKIGERYVAENQGVEIVLPSITVTNRLKLRRGNRVIEIRYLGRGHTSGDIVVFLPKESVLIAGDLIIWPVPYIGSPQSHPGDWGRTLKRVISLKSDIIVPGHGPILRNDSYVNLMAQLFAAMEQQVKVAVERGEDLEQIRKSVNLSEFQRQFAGESRMRKLVFRNYVMGAGIEAAFRDASSKK